MRLSKKFTKLWLLGVVCIWLVIGIMLFILKDRLDPSQQIVEIIIENKKMVQPESPIVIPEGKKVTFLINSDEDEQFHLEGYHAFTSFKANQITKLKFEALSPGTFNFFLDKSHTYLGTIQVEKN